MTWLYPRIRLSSTRSAEEIEARLRGSVEPRLALRLPFLSRALKPFEGTVQLGGFSINRVVQSRNAYRLRVEGRILPETSGCSLEAVLRPQPLLFLIFPLWVGWLGFLFVHVSPMQAWPLLGMLLLGVALMLGGLWYETSRAKRFLRELMA